MWRIQNSQEFLTDSCHPMNVEPAGTIKNIQWQIKDCQEEEEKYRGSSHMK